MRKEKEEDKRKMRRRRSTASLEDLGDFAVLDVTGSKVRTTDGDAEGEDKDTEEEKVGELEGERHLSEEVELEGESDGQNKTTDRPKNKGCDDDRQGLVDVHSDHLCC